MNQILAEGLTILVRGVYAETVTNDADEQCKALRLVLDEMPSADVLAALQASPLVIADSQGHVLGEHAGYTALHEVAVTLRKDAPDGQAILSALEGATVALPSDVQLRTDRLRTQMETAAAALDDQQASACPALAPAYKADQRLIQAGTRIQWQGSLKRAAVDLWATPENAPDTAPDLWEDVLYREGERVIPAVITAGTAFALNECGWWADKLYRSLLSSNVWTPEANPAGWEEA